MKANLLFVMVLITSVRAQVPVTRSGSAPSTNVLSIYLLADSEAFYKHDTNLENFRLDTEPALSDRDFVAYNTNNHCFAITAEAAKRLNLRIKKEKESRGGYMFDWPDAPFVLETFGERVYLGLFSSDLSSVAYGKEPVIKSSRLFISKDDTNAVIFCIEAPHDAYDAMREIARVLVEVKSGSAGATNVGFLKLAKQNARIWAADPRTDKRIIAAVQKLFGDQKP